MSNLDPSRSRPNRWEVNASGNAASAAIDFLIEDAPIRNRLMDGRSVDTKGYTIRLADDSILTVVRAGTDEQIDILKVVSEAGRVSETFRWNTEHPDDESSQSVSHSMDGEALYEASAIGVENWQWINEKLHESLVIKLAGDERIQRTILNQQQSIEQVALVKEVGNLLNAVCQLTGFDPQRFDEVSALAVNIYQEGQQNA